MSDAEYTKVFAKQRARRQTMPNLRVGHTGFTQLAARDQTVCAVGNPTDDLLRGGS
ncbi:MAG: hypothetical protein ACJ74L_07365 [Gaiellaceae bacterium]